MAAKPPRRQCAATPGCRKCQATVKYGICPQCAFTSYFPNKNDRDIVLSIYSGNYFAQYFFNQVPRDKWEPALESIMFEGKARSMDPAQGCSGIMQNLKLKLEQQEKELAALYREKAIREADLTPEGFVRSYQEQGITLQDVSRSTDDQHWYQRCDNLFG